MDLTTFEILQQSLKSHPETNRAFKVEEYPEPLSMQVIVRLEARPSVHHHLVIFPSKVEGMVVRKWWTHDHEVGIETPTQGHASPEMVLQHLHHLLTSDGTQSM